MAVNPAQLIRRIPDGLNALRSLPQTGRRRVQAAAAQALFHELYNVMQRAGRAESLSVFDRLLRALEVELVCPREDLSRIPESGALVVAGNHPTGLLDGAVAAALCLRRRPDVRILVNHLLPFHEDIEPYLIRVDPYERRDSVDRNRAPLREAVRWLRRGGCLVTFPAGDVSRLDWKHWQIADPEWNPSIAGLVRLGRAAALPVHIRAGNSPAFHLLGAVHPRLKTLRLPAELLNKRGSRVEVRVGTAVPFSRLAAFGDREMIAHLQARNILLGKCSARPSPSPLAPGGAPAVVSVPDLLGRSLAGCCLVENGEWAVTLFRGGEDPQLMGTIGRLREAAFRQAGEGTGSEVDVDRFDAHYDQLVLWNLKDRAIGGGYRIGATAEILPRFGPSGLYTSTLFRFRPEFFRRLGPAAELGRSFIAPEYQKLYMALLTLWQGIGAWIRRHPECRRLFGPVSISASYQNVSRLLLVQALTDSALEAELAPFVRPRRPLRDRQARAVRDAWRRLCIRQPEQISDLIASLEPDGKGVPVLLRQYLRLGGRIAAFNVDPQFSNVIDGLIVVDLLRTEKQLLERYLTASGAREFLEFHASQAKAAAVSG